MSLIFEGYHPERREWVILSELSPGDRPASLSQNKPDGMREVYLFECAPDDSCSIINRSTGGIDAANSNVRVVGTQELELVKKLRRGEEPYTLTMLADGDTQGRIFRFSHK